MENEITAKIIAEYFLTKESMTLLCICMVYC